MYFAFLIVSIVIDLNKFLTFRVAFSFPYIYACERHSTVPFSHGAERERESFISQIRVKKVLESRERERVAKSQHLLLERSFVKETTRACKNLSLALAADKNVLVLFDYCSSKEVSRLHPR